VTVVLACLVILAAYHAAQWWSHPDLFSDHGDAMSMDPAPVARAARAAAVTFPGQSDHPTTITFRGATVVFAKDTAHARGELFICRNISGEGPVGYVDAADLRSACSTLRPVVDGTRFTYPDSRDYLVVVLTPRRPGATQLTGVRLTYTMDRSHLWRRGTDTVAMSMTIHAR
jgi:hypothetical protein